MNAFLFAMLSPQEGKPVHPGRKPVLSLSAGAKPVTAREARAAFLRGGGLMQKAHGLVPSAPAIPAADRAATRGEIVAEMMRVYRAAEPTFRFTPAPTKHSTAVFRIEAAQAASLDRLVTRGFVARIGPLAVGPAPGLTPKQFGDALGLFLARLTQVSHLPSPKWTPMLQGP